MSDKASGQIINQKSDQLETSKPDKALRVYAIIAIAILMVIAGVSYLYPHILPKGSFSIALGIFLILAEVAKRFKPVRISLFMLCLGGYSIVDGIRFLI